MRAQLNRRFDGNSVRRSPNQRVPAALTLVELLVVIGILVVLVAMLLPNVRTAREAARRNQCMNNLKQIALALQNYAEVHGALPPAYTTDADGKPLHSWRTLILPFMEEQRLYESMDLTKPWDDPANAEAFQANVPAYRCPSADLDDNHTTYLAVVAPRSFLRPTQSRPLSEITADPSAALIVIEVDAAHAVPWMSPVDADENLVLDLGQDTRSPPHPNGMHAAFLDGRVHFLPAEMPADTRRALITIAGNDSAPAETGD